MKKRFLRAHSLCSINYFAGCFRSGGRFQNWGELDVLLQQGTIWSGFVLRSMEGSRIIAALDERMTETL